MLLLASRRPARVAPDGSLVPLAEQDRHRWDHRLAGEGRALLRRCLRQDRPGPYQLHAAINAVHSAAATIEETDWGQVLTLYDQLLALAPTPVLALNRAVAIAELEGPQAALALVDGLDLDGYHLWHATRADLLRRCGEVEGAAAAYRRAAALTGNGAERRFLERRLDQLVG